MEIIKYSASFTKTRLRTVMDSKVVRFVNIDENTNSTTLKEWIQNKVSLMEDIKQIYCRKCEPLNLYFAYVIFESHVDATNTVRSFNKHLYNNTFLDVALIGPDENYNVYTSQDKRYCVGNKMSYVRPQERVQKLKTVKSTVDTNAAINSQGWHKYLTAIPPVPMKQHTNAFATMRRNTANNNSQGWQKYITPISSVPAQEQQQTNAYATMRINTLNDNPVRRKNIIPISPVLEQKQQTDPSASMVTNTRNNSQHRGKFLAPIPPVSMQQEEAVKNTGTVEITSRISTLPKELMGTNTTNSSQSWRKFLAAIPPVPMQQEAVKNTGTVEIIPRISTLPKETKTIKKSIIERGQDSIQIAPKLIGHDEASSWNLKCQKSYKQYLPMEIKKEVMLEKTGMIRKDGRERIVERKSTRVRAHNQENTMNWISLSEKVINTPETVTKPLFNPTEPLIKENKGIEIERVRISRSPKSIETKTRNCDHKLQNSEKQYITLEKGDTIKNTGVMERNLQVRENIRASSSYGIYRSTNIGAQNSPPITKQEYVVKIPAKKSNDYIFVGDWVNTQQNFATFNAGSTYRTEKCSGNLLGSVLKESQTQQKVIKNPEKQSCIIS